MRRGEIEPPFGGPNVRGPSPTTLRPGGPTFAGVPLADWWEAVIRTWLVLSLLMGIALLVGVLLPADWLYELSSRLSVPHHGHRCPMCGMTHAFVALFHLDPSSATEFNRYSVPFFGLVLLNEILAVRPLRRRLRQALRFFKGERE